MGLIRKLPQFKTYWSSRYALAVDIGQATDFTAICGMEYQKGTEVHISGTERPGGERFNVRYLRRLPLGMNYIHQVSEVAALLDREPLRGGCDFVIDETGVGRPVGDLFQDRRLQPIRVTITGGERQTPMGGRRWHVPKMQLISALDARMHTGELRITPSLQEAEVLREELKEFRRHVSTAGRYSYEARVGKHDDLVLAVSLALWNFVGRIKSIPVAQVGRASLT